MQPLPEFLLTGVQVKSLASNRYGLGQPRDGKTYERASNARVNFFIFWVKSVTNSTLFCRESELCCNFALFVVILMTLTY